MSRSLASGFELVGGMVGGVVGGGIQEGDIGDDQEGDREANIGSSRISQNVTNTMVCPLGPPLGPPLGSPLGPPLGRLLDTLQIREAWHVILVGAFIHSLMSLIEFWALSCIHQRPHSSIHINSEGYHDWNTMSLPKIITRWRYILRQLNRDEGQMFEYRKYLTNQRKSKKKKKIRGGEIK